MPELPEVETTVSYLRNKISGLKIIDVWLDASSIIKKPNISLFKKGLKGRKIENLLRIGKNIIFELDSNRAILIHQKMTGHLLLGKWQKLKGVWRPLKEGPLSDSMNRFLHLIFFLDNGDMLALSDLRKFAKVIFDDKNKIFSLPEILKLGPDVLKVSFDEFKKRIISKKERKIKQVLMDQEVVSGIGNIYSDEILFASKINPFKKVKNLKQKELKNLYTSTKKILDSAVRLKGESFSDYRTPDGKKGNFDKIRKVYRKQGQKCPYCKGLIQRKKIGGRSAHFCPNCQPLK